MWDNQDWAKSHLRKRHPETDPEVAVREAWELVFVTRSIPLVSPDQYRFPPYRRYWTIGRTVSGKLLLVVWEQWRAEKNLITVYSPNTEQVGAYETKIKKNKK